MRSGFTCADFIVESFGGGDGDFYPRATPLDAEKVKDGERRRRGPRPSLAGKSDQASGELCFLLFEAIPV